MAQTFAYLVSLSPDALTALQLRANRHLLVDAREVGTPDQQTPYAARFSYAFLFGRHCLSFGSARSNEIRFPQAEDISRRHFILHFEMQTGLLLITNHSPCNIWMNSDTTAEYSRLVPNTTYPVLQSTRITFGQDQRYSFLLVLPSSGTERVGFFSRYADSIGSPPPKLVQIREPIWRSAVRIDDRFFILDRLGPGHFETVHACLSLSDGKLVAVKLACRSPVGGGGILEPVARQRARMEIELLRNVRHPNVAGFVDYVDGVHHDFLVLELVTGRNLVGLLDDLRPHHMDHRSVQICLRQALYALGFLHDRGISHHGIRPQSILVHSRQPLRIKLCNFSSSERFLSLRPPRKQIERYPVDASARTLNMRLYSTGIDIQALGYVAIDALALWPFEQPSHRTGRSSFQDMTRMFPVLQMLPCTTLLSGMLEIDYTQRFSAGECLQHQWLTRDCGQRRAGSISIDLDMPTSKRARLTGELSDAWLGQDGGPLSLQLESNVPLQLESNVAGDETPTGPPRRTESTGWFHLFSAYLQSFFQ
ncbi:MAG: hypothetical protein LQ349_001120 [Xanthoria aureola]|nr:MAG: hypothetical protein LQ349_001120 [Xanthoria aureola]